MPKQDKKKKSAKAKNAPPKPRSAEPVPYPALSRALLVVMAFVAGASIMIVELAANRVLAPWFGNSLYTWTGLIGVILVAMSGGYYFGGWLVDRRPDYVVLSHLLLAAATLVLVTPLLRAAIGDSFEDADLVWGPALATLLLFALPGALLGSVSPFAVRLVSLASKDQKIGAAAGTIGAASTFGSVIGTFAAGFVLVPHVNLHTIFTVVAIAVAALALAGYGLHFGANKALKTAAAAVIFLVALVAATLGYQPEAAANVVFETTTYYHRIRVKEKPLSGDEIFRSLQLDTTMEGGQYQNSRELPLGYQRYWEVAKVFCPRMERAAFLGGGAFGMPEALLDHYPAAEVDVIEIDPMVVEVGRRYFRVDEYPRLHAVADDARRYLNGTDHRYDLIFGDAYNGVRYVPSHLLTLEFFETVEGRLTDDGVYVMNLISAVRGENSQLFKAVGKTLDAVFEHVYVFSLSSANLAQSSNLIIVCANRELPMEVGTNLEYYEKMRVSGLLAHRVSADAIEFADAPLLTDDYNPVEYIVARSIEQ